MSIDPGAVTARLFDVRGSRAGVTGAASGLGLAVAEVLDGGQLLGEPGGW